MTTTTKSIFFCLQSLDFFARNSLITILSVYILSTIILSRSPSNWLRNSIASSVRPSFSIRLAAINVLFSSCLILDIRSTLVFISSTFSSLLLYACSIIVCSIRAYVLRCIISYNATHRINIIVTHIIIIIERTIIFSASLSVDIICTSLVIITDIIIAAIIITVSLIFTP